MLIFGDHTIPRELKDTLVYNMSSLVEGYERLNLLPQYQVQYNDEVSFDMSYAQFILDNRNVFMDVFRIVFALYCNWHVLILVTRSDAYDIFTESLIKFIQQRYGYNSILVNEPADLLYLEDNSTFSVPGLLNFDIDKEKITEMMVMEYGPEHIIPEGELFITR